MAGEQKQQNDNSKSFNNKSLEVPKIAISKKPIVEEITVDQGQKNEKQKIVFKTRELNRNIIFDATKEEMDRIIEFVSTKRSIKLQMLIVHTIFNQSKTIKIKNGGITMDQDQTFTNIRTDCYVGKEDIIEKAHGFINGPIENDKLGFKAVFHEIFDKTYKLAKDYYYAKKAEEEEKYMENIALSKEEPEEYEEKTEEKNIDLSKVVYLLRSVSKRLYKTQDIDCEVTIKANNNVHYKLSSDSRKIKENEFYLEIRLNGTLYLNDGKYEIGEYVRFCNDEEIDIIKINKAIKKFIDKMNDLRNAEVQLAKKNCIVFMKGGFGTLVHEAIGHHFEEHENLDEEDAIILSQLCCGLNRHITFLTGTIFPSL